MASGDTKTEALLNILGSGGDYSELSGSGNTKTQDYIIAAINKMEELEKKIDEGGGGGGGSALTTLYAPFSVTSSQQSTVHIYHDEALTQAVTGGDLYDILGSEGGVILCTTPSVSGDNYYKLSSTSCILPYEKSSTAFDSYPPEVYFVNYSGIDIAILQYSGGDNPNGTNFSYYYVNS